MLINPSLQEQAALSTLLAQKHRYYHTINHVNDMLVDMEGYLAAIGDPPLSYDREILTYAIWYHDAIYNPYAPLGWNETYSSNLFFQQHQYNKDMDPQVFDAVQVAIHATARHTEHQTEITPITGVLLDIDLAGFGLPFSPYMKNGINIRYEFERTSDDEFFSKRLAFLNRLLERPTLYYSEYFRDRLEKLARDNIKFDIERIVCHQNDKR